MRVRVRGALELSNRDPHSIPYYRFVQDFLFVFDRINHPINPLFLMIEFKELFLKLTLSLNTHIMIIITSGST